VTLPVGIIAVVGEECGLRDVRVLECRSVGFEVLDCLYEGPYLGQVDLGDGVGGRQAVVVIGVNHYGYLQHVTPPA